MELINEYESEHGTVNKELKRNITMEEASKHPEVIRRSKLRFEKLCHYLNEIIHNLKKNVPNMLFGIRWICKQFDSMARLKFGDPRSWPRSSSTSSSSSLSGTITSVHVTADGEHDNNTAVNDDAAHSDAIGDTKEEAAGANDEGVISDTSNEVQVEVEGEEVRCATEKQITAIVCGFFVLRFINPMLIAPDTANLIGTPVSKVRKFFPTLNALHKNIDDDVLLLLAK